MEVEEVVNDEKAAEENLQGNKLVKRHALESWLYPLATFFLALWGPLVSLLGAATMVMGVYCLVRSYINIKNGKGEGILVHVIIGTLLNIITVAYKTMWIFFVALYLSS